MNISIVQIPMEFDNVLTIEQKYQLYILTTANATTNMITTIIYGSFIFGLVLGILLTIMYFKVLKK